MSEENRYWIHDLNELNDKDLMESAKEGCLIGLVDEEMGGIIGYIHVEHAERISKALNNEEGVKAIRWKL